MATGCKFLNPLQRDGTSQRQRLVEALGPAYASVDERQLSDLVNYARRYAKLLQYYTPTNSPGGDWVEFIEQDVTTLVAMIGATDTDTLRKRFEDQHDAVIAAAPPARATSYAALFQPLFDLAETFDEWYRGSSEGLALRSALRRLIGSVLTDVLRDALAHALRAQGLGIPVEPVDTAKFADVWVLSEIRPDPSLFPSEDIGSEEEMLEAVDRLSALFERMYEGLLFFVKDVPAYLQETLDSYPEHKPHMALFLAFLSIFKHAQHHLNKMTAAHLDFYYKEVLKLAHRAEVPDQVHIVFELAKSFATHKLAKDTPLKAGKDATKTELIYATDSELVVNRAVLDEANGLKTVFVDKDRPSGVVKNIYAAPDADSADGKGADIEDEDGKWSTFGGTHMPHARIGFAIASPMFLLAEGTRVVELKFHANSPNFLTGKTVAEVEQELEHNVTVEASGEKEWLSVSVDDVEVSVAEGTIPYVRFRLILGPDLGAVVRYDKKVLEGGYDTALPVIRFLFDNEGLAAGSIDLSQAGELIDYSDKTKTYPHDTLVRYEGKVYRAKLGIAEAGFRPKNYPQLWDPIEFSYPYRYFERMEIREMDIALDVDGVKTLVIENDVGLLDPAKPFHPFGPVPRVGSRFLIGSHEAFQKSLTKVELALTWADLPSTSFPSYYVDYGTDAPSTNQHFTAKLQVLQSGVWVPGAAAPQALFDNQANDAPAPDKSFTASGELVTFQRDAKLASFDRFDTTLRQGFMKLSLDTSFLHREYPAKLATAAAAGGGDIPNPPYTPLIASLSLDYEANESVSFAAMDRDDFATRVEQVFQIGPFGQREIFPIPDDPAATDVPITRKLVPEFTVTVEAADGTTSKAIAEGTLYIGIDQLEPPQNLSIALQIAEGSEDPEAEVQPVVWSYLAGTGWHDFEASEVIADGTNGLLRSGVIKLAMPKGMTSKGSLLPSGLHWIKASVAQDSKAVPKLIAIQPQAVAASFRNQGNDPLHLRQPLPAGTIGKLKSREAAIKTVTQSYASFGGRMREADRAFYIRVSERLRHKGRAVTIFDYERLVLEKFPEVYKVKCVNHTSKASEHAPGHVKLVVVPNLRNQNAVDPLKPRLSLSKLEEIREHLARVASDFVHIEVANPSYEEVRVRLKVRFQPGRDKGLYTAQLEQDVIRFLSPWLYDDATDLVFGGRIHRSSILNYVEEREYVDFVTQFEMDHIIGELSRPHVEQAEASSSSAALVAAKTHEIDPNVTSCGDEIRRRRTCEEPESEVEPPPTSEAPPFVVPAGFQRYLGNTRSRELHDLLNLTDFCQVGEIALDRRYYFSKTTEAAAMGYDFCAYCFPKGLSKR